MPSSIAAGDQVIHYYGTVHKVHKIVVNDNGTASVDLDPANETIAAAIRQVIAKDPHHTIDFAVLEKELNAQVPNGLSDQQ